MGHGTDSVHFAHVSVGVESGGWGCGEGEGWSGSCVGGGWGWGVEWGGDRGCGIRGWWTLCIFQS